MNRNFRLWLIQRVDDFLRSFFVVDCDGPIVESVPEMAEFMSAQIKQRALSRRAIAKESCLLLDGMRFALGEEEVAERADLTIQNRQAVLVDNATRIFSL